MANKIKILDTEISIGDTVRLSYAFSEGSKQKDQIFTGILIKIRGKDSNKMITIRKNTKSGIGVERIIPAISPYIKSVKVEKKGVVRRSKLNYIRKLSERDLRERLS